MSAAGLRGPQQPQRQTLLLKDLAPWTPDIDSRRSDKPSIVTGQNFRQALDGPYSGYSSGFVNDNFWTQTTRAKFTELQIDNDLLYGTCTGVYRIDPSSLVAWNILPITVTNQFWPWTIAKVGSFYYICQYDIGLWQYDPVNLTMTQITTPSGNQIRCVAESYGRLIYFDSSVVAQSALDDGTNFIPNLATAAGAQSLALVGGTPYAIVSIPDGFLVYMSGGVMKATYTTQAYIFAYTNLSEGIKLFNPNAAVYCPLLGAITLDNNGFFLTREYNYTTYGYPQPWEVQMSDYIKKNILAGLNFANFASIGMYYSKAMQCLFFFFGSNFSTGLFQTTLVYDCISQKWGSFDQPHYGIFETYDYTTNTYTCSFMDVNGYMKEFTNSNFSEDYPDDNTNLNDYIYRPTLGDWPFYADTYTTINGGSPFYEVRTEIKFSDHNPNYYHQFGTSGLYEINSDTMSDIFNGQQDIGIDPMQNPILTGSFLDFDYSGPTFLYAVPYMINEIGLASFVTIGPFRFNDEQSFAEEVSEVESIMVGIQGNNSFLIFEDWNTIIAAEDWNSLTAVEDWGSNTQVPNSYECVLSDTNDGFSTPFFGDEDLNVFIDYGSSQLYKPTGISSIYHTVTISADNVGDLYAVKILDLTAQLTGVQQDI